jgi:anion-transporting  ArsA/GET3 family ATPase
MVRGLSSLLERRLIFVSGKGGVGKSTVALCLGLLAARGGRRCLMVEIDTNGVLPARYGRPAGKLGEAVELQPRLYSMIVEGRAALDEYLRMILPGAVLWPILGSKVYEYFVAGAPGLKELMCMGKIFYEVDRNDRGRPLWDLVVVDAPATGHGLEYYRMPQAAHDTFAVGLVHRETERVLTLMRDPALTLHLLVTLAEELPVSETLQLYRSIHDELRFPLGPIVVNRYHHEGLSPELHSRLRAFHAEVVAGPPDGASAAGDRALLDEILEQAELSQAEHLENRRQIERLQAELDVPQILLPAVFQPNLTPDTLEPLISSLDVQSRVPAPAAAPLDGQRERDAGQDVSRS